MYDSAKQRFFDISSHDRWFWSCTNCKSSSDVSSGCIQCIRHRHLASLSSAWLSGKSSLYVSPNLPRATFSIWCTSTDLFVVFVLTLATSHLSGIDQPHSFTMVPPDWSVVRPVIQTATARMKYDRYVSHNWPRVPSFICQEALDIFLTFLQ